MPVRIGPRALLRDGRVPSSACGANSNNRLAGRCSPTTVARSLCMEVVVAFPPKEEHMRYRLSWLSAVLVSRGVGPAWAQTRIITGRVSDSTTSQPVVSGQVAVQGAGTGTSIKDDGTFTLAVPARDVVVMFRSIGFKRKDV